MNKILKFFGLVLSKPDFIHGSPAFSGSLVFSRRIFQTNELLKELKNIEGDILEGGVHWGYGLLIELILTNKHIYAFDSFEGHSSPKKNDKNSSLFINFGNSFKVSKEDAIKTILLGSNINEDELASRVTFYEGWINETIIPWREYMLINNKKLAYVHADMDIYEPMKILLTSTFPFLNKGTIVQVGHINNPELMGKTDAFN